MIFKVIAFTRHTLPRLPYRKAAERARERREEAIALREEGVSGAEIARRLGISEPAVVAILRELRPGPPPRAAETLRGQRRWWPFRTPPRPRTW